MEPAGGLLSIVSTGPGSPDHITPSARAALAQSHVIVGYRLYLAQLGTLLDGKDVLAFDMGQERARAEAAIDLALAGQRAALASGGDAGVYGIWLASLFAAWKSEAVLWTLSPWR